MRIHRLIILVVATACFCLTGPSRAANNCTLPNCLVTTIEEAQVPAQEAGVLVSIEVKEGHSVKRDQPLAQIEDGQPRLQRAAIDAEEKAAREKADNDIDVRFAKASADVAAAEYEKAKSANGKATGAFSEVEVERLKLAWIKAKLQIEQANVEHRMNALTAQQKKAELAVADNNIARRKITSPIDGIVVQVNSRVGEWRKPGDPVLRLIRMDRLRVEGHLRAANYNDDEINGRDVEVEVTLAHEEKLKFPGRVVFVSPMVEAAGEYTVWAEVDNRQGPNQNWLLRPGVNATMTVILP